MVMAMLSRKHGKMKIRCMRNKKGKKMEKFEIKLLIEEDTPALVATAYDWHTANVIYAALMEDGQSEHSIYGIFQNGEEVNPAE